MSGIQEPEALTLERKIDLLDALVADSPHPEAASRLVEGLEDTSRVRGQSVFRRSASDGPAKRKALADALENGEAAPKLPGLRTRKRELDLKRKTLIAKALSGDEADPMMVMLDNMRFWHRAAKQREALLAKTIETEGQAVATASLRADFEEVAAIRTLSQAAAREAAPYLHAKLAPKLDKGQTGLTVNLVIEDA